MMLKFLPLTAEGSHPNSRKISKFMNQCLKSRIKYNIAFWDIGYTYEVGQTPDGDWIGTSCEYEFEYNP